MKLIWGLLFGAMLFALPARADTIYDVNATATITGNDVCGGVCVETVSFSLQLDPLAGGPTDVLPGGTFTSSGPIPYGSGSIEPGPLDPVTGSIGFNYDPPGGFGVDVLLMNLGCGGSIPIGYPQFCTPKLGWTGFVDCTGACVADFCQQLCAEEGTETCYVSGQYITEPPGTPYMSGCGIDGGGGQIPIAVGTLVGTITLEPPSIPTPEPGEAGLLIVGIGLLWLACRSGMHPGRMSLSS